MRYARCAWRFLRKKRREWEREHLSKNIWNRLSSLSRVALCPGFYCSGIQDSVQLHGTHVIVGDHILVNKLCME
jgi:hypothetical protein